MRKLRLPAPALRLMQRGAGFALVLAVIFGAHLGGVLSQLDDGIAEMRFRLLQRPVSGALAIVEIDTTSVRAAGRWPWGRERYATAIRNLQAAGATVVAFDVDFSAPSSPDDDRLMQAAVAARPGSVILPTFVQRRSGAQGAEVVESSPLAGLAEEAVLASVNVPVDKDGLVRRYAYGFEAPGGARPSLGNLLAETASGRSGGFLLDYGIRVENTPRLSFEDVYLGRFDPAAVRGRAILIGATALELGDEFATPRFGTLPGVYVHALAYESVRSGRDLQRVHPYVALLLAGVVAFLLRPRRAALSLKRLVAAHLGVTTGALALPTLMQAALPFTLDVAPFLLAQVLMLVWTVRTELNRRARAMIEAREAHLVQMAQHMRQSRNRIQAANKKLRVANAALDKALKARTEFLASTSHEIRTPLNGILGMTQVILADRDLAAPVREKVGVVQSAGETMLALVDDILDVAKMETGNLVVAPEEMDLHRLLDDAAHLWSGRAQEKGLALRTSREGVPTRIVEDVTRLRQIISNLMSNAIKFTDQGHVELSARVERRRGRADLVLEVSDTGIGIPADKLEEVFESFRQVDGSVTRQYGGTGLGLAICRQLAVAMGGSVSVRSVIGEGSVFTVRLPLRAAQAAPASQAGGLGGVRVLLVEANPLARSVLKAALADKVAGLALAGSVDEALAALATGRSDLVLADGATLALGGTAASGLSRIVGQAGGARLAVLWGGAAEDVQALIEAGADHVAQKPISTGDLVAALTALTASAPRLSQEKRRRPAIR